MTGYAVSYYRGECDGNCRHGSGAELISGAVIAFVGMILAIVLALVAARARSERASNRWFGTLFIAELVALGIWLIVVLG
jgi:hypothetical protein